MSEQVIPPVSPATSTSTSSTDPALDQDQECVRRLLLYEVVLEEYASLPQPPIPEEKLDEIRQCGYLSKAAALRIDESERDEFEKQFSAELFSKVNELMREAQSKVASDKIGELKSQYEQIYNDVEARKKESVVDRAVAYDIRGVIDDLWNRFWTRHSHIVDQTERTRQTKKAVNGRIKGEIPKSSGTGSPGEELDDARKNHLKEDDDQDAEAKLRAEYAQTLRSALCLSGGGIRSATFNLGILQGLARHGLLEQFDYLSTVSGGGFAGSWLTAWIHRQGTQAVMRELKEPPPSSLSPDPKPVEQLRVYSNYLSPRPGLLSADTWTLVAMMLRNLLLTWLVFMPWLVAALMVPRMLTKLVLPTYRHLFEPWHEWLILGIGFFAIVWAFSYIGLSLPVSNSGARGPHPDVRKRAQTRFLWLCLLPLVIGAVALASYGAVPGLDYPLWNYLLFTVAFIVIPLALCYLKIARKVRSQKNRSKRSFDLRRFVKSTLNTLLAQVGLGGLLWYAATHVQPLLIPNHPLLYAAFAVPVLLLFLALSGTLIAGFTSRYTNDEDQEWWGRLGAWILIIVFLWSVVHLLVLYGPLLVLGLQFHWDGENLSKILGTVLGIACGVITIYGGFSNKTPPQEEGSNRNGVGGKMLSSLTSLVAPIFLAFLIILITLATNWLLTSTAGRPLWNYFTLHPTPWFYLTVNAPISPSDHAALLIAAPLRYLFVMSLIVLFFGWLMGRLINSNAFSAHYIWRNRIIRAYLGASRPEREGDPFTGFDTYDNLQMYELRPQPPGAGPVPLREGRPELDKQLPDEPPRRKLLHVLNMALNLVGGDKLAWQDRKAESFTVSPLHAGCYWLGYRRSHEYGGPEGISLGTAVAISGAFVSPNMGYMMSSAVVRFLMTLFNVRFGWWLGNPGAAGDETSRFERFLIQLGRVVRVPVARPFQLASPRLSVIPIVQEAFGKTNDKSSYVYLSDGGHFENLGLYEMVLRRCRFIVISDASSDAHYSFDSLAMAIRQIRVDLGVPIDVPEMSITAPSENMKNKYCAVGKIRYSCVDREPDDPAHQKMKDEDFDGILIFIKASMIGEEPRDVLNYGHASKAFPQEIIVDQWFSESQFESYRALGAHIIHTICDGDQNQVSLAAFARKAREHNRFNLSAYRAEINYAAFEHQAKEVLAGHPIPSYRQRVQDYLNKLLR
jgi:hypothetical protein